MPTVKILLQDIVHTYTYKTLFNQASLNNCWEADFHEGREI